MATNNPFLGDVMYGAGGGAVQGQADQAQYYGRGYTQVITINTLIKLTINYQAQSGYSSSGLGY